jgi:hypothetical protein
MLSGKDGNAKGDITMTHIEKTIEELKRKVIEREQGVIEAKKAVNSLCKLVGKEPEYSIAEPSEMPIGKLQGDEYYGKPLATVITKILESRKKQGAGPAKVKDIYDQMTVGSYKFDAKSDANAMRGIRISMSKNPKFHKLPNGKWGLTEWYPSLKGAKETAGSKTEEIEIEEPADEKEQ